MIHFCCVCDKLIQDEDRVIVEVESTYHQIPSAQYFALSKQELESNTETLRHKTCPKED
jgi:hypothetical protein